MGTPMKIFGSLRNILIAFFFFPFTVWCGEERIITSLSGEMLARGTGKNISTTSSNNFPSLEIRDQRYGYMVSNPSTYSNFFVNKKGYINVVLRFDDAKKKHYSTNWTCTVTYDIKYWDATGNLLGNSNGKTLTIDYKMGAGTSYKDYSMEQFPNAHRAEVFVRNISGVNLSSSDYSDIYLDLEQVTERYYVLNTTNQIIITPSNLVSGVVPPSPAGNILELAWGYEHGAESYDLEWVFVDIPTQQFSGTINAPYSFVNATRINTVNNNYTIPLGYPRGVIIYRVRPVGINTTDWTRVEGRWSFEPTTLDLNATTQNFHYRYDYNGMNLEKNWQYSAVYAEDGKRKEVVSFFDGSLRNRQTVTVMNTDGNAIIAETKYDYVGRPVVQILPAPLSSTGVHYYTNFNPGFDKANFDDGVKVTCPDPIPNNVQGGNGAGWYYSSLNTSNYLNDTYTPDAGGFPYSRVRYKNDGSNRIRSQSGVGPDHKTGSGHETKYAYGSANQTELDRLFGNEVGFASHYQKNMVTDPNKQVTVSYLDQQGRVIATALAGDVPENLLKVDYTPTQFPVVTENLLLNKNLISQDFSMIADNNILVTSPQTYTFTYSLTDDEYCFTCTPPNQQIPFSFCRDCLYDLEIRITDEDGALVTASITSQSCSTAVTGNPIQCTAISTGSYIFTVNFAIPGSYKITKVLKPNLASALAFSNALKESLLNQNPGCIEVPLINPEPCEFDCESMCERAYKKYDINGNFLFYIDANGDSTSPAAGQNLIAACTTDCGNPGYPTKCDILKNILITDMSPGGQYFDNHPGEYTFNSEGQMILNSNYNRNAWLNSNLASTGFWNGFNAHIQGTGSGQCNLPSLSVNNWDSARKYWNPCMAEYLILYHPEYCQYFHECEAMVCRPAGNLPVSIGNSNNFDWQMTMISDDNTAASNGFFNPAGFSNNTNTSTNDPQNGNSNYINGSAPGSPDPFFIITGTTPCSNKQVCNNQSEFNTLQEYLQYFFPVDNTSPQAYYSIWYVLDNPHNIHTCTTCNAPTSAVNFFKTLYGDGTNPGVIGNGSGQITKYQFFRSAYQFYKELIKYKAYPIETPNPPDSCQPRLTDVGDMKTSTGFHIRFPKNEIFENLGCPKLNPTTVINSMLTVQNNTMAPACSSSCEGYADGWINQLASCSLSVSDKNTIRGYMTQLCSLNCLVGNNPESGCPDCPTPTCSTTVTPCQSVTVTVSSGNITCYTFDQIISAVTNAGCTLHVEHPDKYYPGVCSCENLKDIFTQNGLSTTNSTDRGTVATMLNNIYNTSFTATTVNDWLNECNTSNPPLVSTLTNQLNFPQGLVCPDVQGFTPEYKQGSCSCENLSYFISMFDLPVTDYGMIATMLNKTINPATAFTAQNVQAWLSECNNTSPSQSTLDGNNFPLKFKCPTPAGTSPDQISEVLVASQCMRSNLFAAISNSALVFQQNLSAISTSQYVNSYVNTCLNNLAGRESFTMQYQPKEYYYTLYYYDQAGNLIKTVPPQGVNPITNAQTLADINTYRTTGQGSFIWPEHQLITNYKYNSLQQVFTQTTPDAGNSNFWYDKLGRLVVSQNSKQISQDKYSYTLYDDLGRIIEVGEIYNTTPMTDDIARDKTTPGLLSWLTGNPPHPKNSVTRTQYDLSLNSTVSGFFGASGQENLRGRVATTYISKDGSGNYEHAVHYSYDIHGNVKTLITESNDTRLISMNEHLRRVDYEYDLLSGNVNYVRYQYENFVQAGKFNDFDQLHHHYNYDADNRVIRVFTSRDNLIWDRDGKYFYYKHGPLARTETGEKQVQGSDHVYTIHGWIKGVNSNTLNTGRDPGKDGNPGTNLNGGFATDGFGYTLQYYLGQSYNQACTLSTVGDYKPVGNISSSNHFEASTSGSTFGSEIHSLFNGNIAAMVTAFLDNTQNLVPPNGNVYRYDQLNRIKTVNSRRSLDISNNSWPGSNPSDGLYHEEFVYDLNGNIVNVGRNGNNTSSLPMDNFTYNYYTNTAGSYWSPDPSSGNYIFTLASQNPTMNFTNRLSHVDDLVSNTAYGEDIDDQNLNNYGYDGIGNLISDVAEKIGAIEWNVYGKITKITRSSGDNPDLEFGYDAMGNRVVKIVKPRLGGNPTNEANWIYTYYQRDAQGNVLATYERTFEDIQGTMNDRYNLKELYIYGSNRIGMIQDPNPPRDYPFTFTGIDGTTLQFTGVTYTGSPAPWGNLFANREYGRKLGNKVFEFSNHLGNVLMTASDRKLSVDQGSDGITDYYLPDVLSSQDYYAFGATMPGRNANPGLYRYSVNGHEKDDEIKGVGNHISFGDYGYDPRTGKRWSRDKMAHKMPGLSPYSAFANNPILMFDADGLWPWPIWARSFISTSTTGGGTFRGDGRGPSLATDKSVTSRVWLNFTYDATALNIPKDKVNVGSDFTLFYGIPPNIPPKVDVGKPSVSMSPVTSTKNSFGNDIGSFGFHYWGKDPITPQWATPALDVHANFSITENMETGTLFVNATFTGDKFPSTEAFIEDQSGFKLFLGARKEEGGLGDLFGDNKLFLFNVDMQIKFDDDGNFLGVYDQENDTYISPDAWNKQVQSQWDEQ
jgi:hypothetical protein